MQVRIIVFYSLKNNNNTDFPPQQVASLFDDSDSGDDIFASASPGSRSLKSSDRTPSKAKTQKKISLFDDDDDDLFGPKDAPDVDLFAAAPVKSLSKVTDGLFVEPSADGGLFGETPKTSEKSISSATVSSLFGEASNSEGTSKDSVHSLFGDKSKKASDTKTSGDSLFDDSSKKTSDSKSIGDSLFGETSKSVSSESKESAKESVSGLFKEPAKSVSAESKEPTKEPVGGLFKEPAKVEKVQEKKSSKGLFEDSEDSDLFPKVAKPAPEKISNSYPSSSQSLFQDTPDSDLFGSSSTSILEKNIVEKSSDSLFGKPEKPTALFGSSTKSAGQNSPKDLFGDKPKPKKLATSIFDDSDEDDQDLFGGSSFAKKGNNKQSPSIFEQDKIMDSAKSMDEEKNKAEPEKASVEKKDKKKAEDAPNNSKATPKTSKATPKAPVSSSIFDDDSDDDLFGDRKKKAEKSNDKVKHTKKEPKEEKKPETKKKTEPAAKPEPPSQKAILAEIKQKLEKHNIVVPSESPAKKPESQSAVDGAVSSKKEPPKTLKIQMNLPLPSEPSQQQPAPKKPPVSGKIKNLQGRIGDLKILSPTDTPPLFRKNNNNEEKAKDDDEKEADLGSSEASSPSLTSGGSSPQTSGESIWL